MDFKTNLTHLLAAGLQQVLPAPTDKAGQHEEVKLPANHQRDQQAIRNHTPLHRKQSEAKFTDRVGGQRARNNSVGSKNAAASQTVNSAQPPMSREQLQDQLGQIGDKVKSLMSSCDPIVDMFNKKAGYTDAPPSNLGETASHALTKSMMDIAEKIGLIGVDNAMRLLDAQSANGQDDDYHRRHNMNTESDSFASAPPESFTEPTLQKASTPATEPLAEQGHLKGKQEGETQPLAEKKADPELPPRTNPSAAPTSAALPTSTPAAASTSTPVASTSTPATEQKPVQTTPSPLASQKPSLPAAQPQVDSVPTPAASTATPRPQSAVRTDKTQAAPGETGDKHAKPAGGHGLRMPSMLQRRASESAAAPAQPTLQRSNSEPAPSKRGMGTEVKEQLVRNFTKFIPGVNSAVAAKQMQKKLAPIAAQMPGGGSLPANPGSISSLNERMSAMQSQFSSNYASAVSSPGNMTPESGYMTPQGGSNATKDLTDKMDQIKQNAAQSMAALDPSKSASATPNRTTLPGGTLPNEPAQGSDSIQQLMTRLGQIQERHDTAVAGLKQPPAPAATDPQALVENITQRGANAAIAAETRSVPLAETPRSAATPAGNSGTASPASTVSSEDSGSALTGSSYDSSKAASKESLVSPITVPSTPAEPDVAAQALSAEKAKTVRDKDDLDVEAKNAATGKAGEK